VEFSLSDEEFGALGDAAARAGLARGAYAAEAALSAARGVTSSADVPFREALGEFVRAAGLVLRIGVNMKAARRRGTADRHGRSLASTRTRRPDWLPWAGMSATSTVPPARPMKSRL